jgi:hypothetical protein
LVTDEATRRRASPADAPEVWEDYNAEEWRAAALLQQFTAEELQARAEHAVVLNANVARTQATMAEFHQSFNPNFQQRFARSAAALRARAEDKPKPRTAVGAPEPRVAAGAPASARIEVDVLMRCDPCIAAVGMAAPLQFTDESLLALARDAQARGGGGPHGQALPWPP